ncbi:hypothetical protein ACS0TY_034584 [Phlomoides rotata]
MSRLQKFRVSHVLKWVSLSCVQSSFTSPKANICVNGSYHILQYLRLYGSESGVIVKRSGNAGEIVKISRGVRKQVQTALTEYFHLTRSLRIMDAENMSKNAPDFFDKLLKEVDLGEDSSGVGRSVARFLRYHPVNEFEPFFESIGLKPSEYLPFLPRDLMFLSDDELLLENYYTLCTYGIARNKIGKIYIEAMEVFRYDYGVLQSKLRSFENLGLRQSLVAKIIASSPYLLKEKIVNKEFIDVLEKLKKVGIDYNWLEQHISVEDSYNWKCMLQLMCSFCELGFSEKQVGELLTQHPNLLLEGSGHITSILVGLMWKFGSTLSDVQTMFLQFPQLSVSKFTYNLCNCYRFLVEIDMDVQYIGTIVRSDSILLGSCELKRVNSLLCLLSCGKERVCQMIKDDPFTLKKWVLGVKVEPLEVDKRIVKIRRMKTQFLLSLGFVEKSKDMERAYKAFRGKGGELQKRFDCLVSNGFSHAEVVGMLKTCPQILNMSSEVLETKIQFFVNDLGYRVSDLLTHPKTLSYTIERLKLRLLTYKWLRDERAVHPKLSLSTLLSISEEGFVKSYVNCHPEGPNFWERLKKEIGCEK